MAIDFPANPTTNDTFTVGSITYKWDGAKWIGLGVTPTDRLIEGNNKLEIDASNNLIWTGNNVGINTTNPSSPLHIGQSTDNAVTAGITLKNNPSIGAQRFTLYNEEDVGTHYNSNDEGIARAHIFETGGTQRLLITTDKVMFSVDAKVDSNNARDLGASGAKWKNLYLGSLASIGGAQFNSNVTPGSGEGVEIFCPSSGVGQISSYDRTNSDWDALRIKASQLEISTEGTERMRITSTGGFLLSNGILVEHCKIVSTAWSTTNDISLDDGNVFLNTANLAGTNNTIDITSSAGLNVDLAVGDMTSVTLITAVNATTAYINAITIGASAVTESWVGGSAPTDGGDSGYDVYTFNIIKTAANTYVCIANQVKGS